MKYGFSNSSFSVAKYRDTDSGQALVEAALVIPLLALILVGVAEVAHVAYALIEVSNAAKAGVQYGAQNGGTAQDQTGIANAAANDAYNLDQTNFLATSSYSCICSDGTASTCTQGDCSSSHIVETVEVDTTYTIHPLFNYPGISNTYTLHGQAKQKCGQ
jgi:Flp pilus assembly protein TadG